MKVSITGASGNIGELVLKEILKLDFVTSVRILCHRKKSIDKVIRENRKHKEKMIIIIGSIDNPHVCEELVEDTDLIINLAGVIPPLSDNHPNLAVKCNEIGVKELVKAIEESEIQPKLIHMSTVAIYGNRNEKHPFGTTSDPVMPTPLDMYSITKMRGEYSILESDIENWSILRQTAVFYDSLLLKNVSDGLIFQTPFNAPFDWVTARDTATLIKNILIEENNHNLNTSNFWKKCFNIGSLDENRMTYFEVIDRGFKIIGGNAKDFFSPNNNSLRNFHGMWFEDKNQLEELFHFQNESVEEFWTTVGKKYWYFKLGRLVPKKWIRKLVLDKLLKDKNAPRYWIDSNNIPKIIAFFGPNGRENELSDNWDDFNLISKGKKEDGTPIDYQAFKNNSFLMDYHFDIKKDDKDITIEDLKNVAKAHGGKLLSLSYSGDVYEKLEWETQDKEKFIARPYTILRCGHWMNISYKEYAWDFDRLSKKDKIYQEIWYDSHDKDENYYYYLDENFEERVK